MSFNGTSMFAAGRRDRVVVRAADVLLRLTSKTYRRKLADLLLVGVMALPAKSPETSPTAASVVRSEPTETNRTTSPDEPAAV